MYKTQNKTVSVLTRYVYKRKQNSKLINTLCLQKKTESIETLCLQNKTNKTKQMKTKEIQNK